MNTDRRTLLSFLGLAPAAAVGIESFMAPPDRVGAIQSTAAAYDEERFAGAFEKLASAIRNKQISISSLAMSAELNGDDIADQHILTMKFIHHPEA